MSNYAKYVLDAGVLKAWFGDQSPAAARIDGLPDDDVVCVSQMTAASVVWAAPAADGADAHERKQRLQADDAIDLVSVSDDHIWRAARLEARHGLSLADASAAALAVATGATLLSVSPDGRKNCPNYASIDSAQGLRVEHVHRKPTDSQSAAVPHASDEPSARDQLDRLAAWRDDPTSIKLSEARGAVKAYVGAVDDQLLGEVVPYAAAIFAHRGYLKDFRVLDRLAARAGRQDVLEDVDDATRQHLPDIWIKRAIGRGQLDAAVACWFDHHDHRRARLCADELIAACGLADAELVISCRMAAVTYRIGRRARRHYRRACTVLRRLKDELEDAHNQAYWPYVIEDIQTQYASRPALMDELQKAGFVD